MRGEKTFAILLSFLLLSITSSRATDLKRQDLPSETLSGSSEDLEQESVGEPEEKPVPGEKKEKPSRAPMSLKKFYKDHFSTVLGVSEYWDSNIFLDEDEEENDFVTLLNPDVNLHFGGDLGYIESEWIGRYAYYASSDEIVQSNSLSGLAFLTPNARFAVGSRASWDVTEESKVATFFGDRILQLGYDIISVQPQVKMQLAQRWVSEFSYQYDQIDVDDKDLDDPVDREAHGFISNLEFEINPTLFLTGGYALREMNFPEVEEKDSFSNLYSGGFKKKFPNLFNADLKFTYDEKDFDECNCSLPSPDDNHLDIVGGLTSTFSRYTTFIFTASSSLQDSSRSEFTQYNSTRFSLVFQHYLTKKTVLILKGSYELQSFDKSNVLLSSITEDQDTELYNASLDVRRIIFSWLSVEAGYSFQERDTDFPSEDLQDHIVRWGLKAYF
ncbi:MAG: outer membrane beta-barrel protein [Chlamydiae bacterium]|nr:outer membrane beta-barrel protein [Chlamydiota bacterium]MBI3265783.1 outer membrane beta-barrel protein [Chlamydiota bacterium]